MKYKVTVPTGRAIAEDDSKVIWLRKNFGHAYDANTKTGRWQYYEITEFIEATMHDSPGIKGRWVSNRHYLFSDEKDLLLFLLIWPK